MQDTIILQTPDTRSNCYWLEEASVCKPEVVPLRKMSRGTRKRLRELAEQKAVACSKIKLLKCLMEELEKQSKVWRLFNSSQGDFLPSRKVRLEKLCNGHVPNPMELTQLKGLAHCVNTKQNLCYEMHH